MASRGAVHDYLARFFDGLFREVEGTVSAGTVPTLLVTQNPERIGLAIVNFGTSPIVVAPSAGVSTSRGIQLINGGGSLTMNVFQDGALPGREWYAISAVAGQTVYLLETVRDVAYNAAPTRQG